MIQNVVAVIRHIEIGVAVVVIVAGRDAHALVGVSQAGRFGNIGEGEFAARIQVIPEQAVAGFPARRHRDQRFALRIGRIALDQKNVHIAVVVVVDQRGAGSHHFRQKEFSGGAGILPEVDPALFGDILKREERCAGGLARKQKLRAEGGKEPVSYRGFFHIDAFISSRAPSSKSESRSMTMEAGRTQ